MNTAALIVLLSNRVDILKVLLSYFPLQSLLSRSSYQ